MFVYLMFIGIKATKPRVVLYPIKLFIIPFNLPLIKGLLIIGVSAMAMSSADSFINGSAVLFGYDVKEVMNIQVNHLVLSKLFSFVLGLFAIYLALSTNDLLLL